MKKKLVLLFVFSLFFAGCAGKDIENRSFVAAAGINNEKGEYKISLGLISPVKNNLLNSEIYTEKNCVPVLNDKTAMENGKSLYLGQMKAVVLGKDFIEKGGIDSFLDAAENDPDINMKTIIASYDGDCELLLNTMAENQNSLYLWNYYRNTESLPKNEKTDLQSFIRDKDMFGAAAIPIVRFDDKKIFVSGAYLYKDSVCGELSEKEMYGLMLLKGGLKNCRIKTQKGDFYITWQKTRLSFYDNGERPCADIKINITAQPYSYGGKITGDDISAEMLNDITTCIKKLQDSDADVSGIMYAMKNKSPKLFSKYENDILRKTAFNISLNVKISDSCYKTAA